MSVTPDQITLGMQIAAVDREIGMRKSVYPRQVGQGKMKQATADLQIAAMEAVLLTMRGVEQAIRGYRASLDNRENGDVAANRAIRAIEALLR